MTLDDMVDITNDTLRTIKLQGWMRIGLLPAFGAYVAGYRTVGASLVVRVRPAEEPTAKRIVLTVRSPILTLEDGGDVRVFARVATARLRVKPRTETDPDRIREAICQAAHDMLGFILLHELGELLHVGDRRPWYPVAEHGAEAVTPADAGWGL